MRHQTRKLLHSKGNNQQSEKTTYGMGENVFLKEQDSDKDVYKAYI
jgi:hypothetical protein